MAETKDKLRKAFRQKIKGKNGFMTEEKYEKEIDRIRDSKNLRGDRRALMEDLTDYNRYNSSSKREAIPYERQREMGVSNPKKPKGAMYPDTDEAYRRMQEKRRGIRRRK